MASRLAQQLGTRFADGPVAAGLADRITALILDGRLVVGERLPSERALAADLGRSRATVTAAYDRLHERGYVSRLHGGGTHVTLPHRSDLTAGPTAVSPDGAVVDFSIASTGATPGLHEATVRALSRLAELLGTTGYELQGRPELRERIAQRYADRGLPTSADEIVVTNGAMGAITLALAAFGRHGRTALVEQPTFPNAMRALRRTGHRLLPSPVTPEGWDARHLTDLILRARPHLAYLIPDFHNPTGATMPDDERAVLAATAQSAGTMLLVDETCAELDIDRGWDPLPLAAHGPAITVGSMSKIAWGGLRVGWIRAPRELVPRILAERSSVDLGGALLEQCIAVELLDDAPALRAHTRAKLAAGRDAVRTGLRELPGAVMPPMHGGLSAWVDLGEPVSTQLSLAAHAHGLRLPPGPRFATGDVLERFIRIPITWDPTVLADGLTRLGRAWRDTHAGRTPYGPAELRAVV